LTRAPLSRRSPGRRGESLAILYFPNSLGAAIGVLASGFAMIEALGLPGTVQVAGALNVTLAAVVWALARDAEPTSARPAAARDDRGAGPVRLFLAIALLTGAASFAFE